MYSTARQFDQLPLSICKQIWGGENVTYRWAVDSAGFFYWSDDDGETWYRFQAIPEVVVSPRPDTVSGSGTSFTNILDTGYKAGVYVPSTGGGGGSGGSSNGVSASVQNRFDMLLTATGLTNDVFGLSFDAVGYLAKLGDFADEAKTVLKSIQRYSGRLGASINVINSAIEAYKLGNATREETIEILANITGLGVGTVINFIPYVGTVTSMVYFYADGDVWVQNVIRDLVIKHFPKEDENTPPGNQGPGL